MRMSTLLRPVTVSLLLSFTGCASSTLIRSTPSGAKVFLDDVPVGRTPYTMTDMKIVGSVTRIRLEKPGYEPVSTAISRSEELDPLACVGSALFLVPVLWMMRYVPEHAYTLQPTGQPTDGGTPDAPAPSDQM